MRVWSPLGVAIAIALLTMSLLLQPSPEAVREQNRLDVRATAQAHRTMSVAATETTRARHCTSSERVVVNARLHPPPGQSDRWYYATGTVRNTCNYPLRLRLDIDGLSTDREESVVAVRPELKLAAHEERHFVEVLAPFQAGYIDRLIIEPKIWLESRGGDTAGDSYTR